MRIGFASVIAGAIILGPASAAPLEDCIHASWIELPTQSYIGFVGPRDFPNIGGRILDPETGRELAKAAGGAVAIADLVMLFDDKGAKSIWSVEPWRRLFPLPPALDKVWATPGGRHLWANAAGDNVLLRLPDGREVLRISERFRLEVSPDDKRMAAFEGNEVQLWNLETGTLLATFNHSGPIGRIALSNAGGVIAVNSPKSGTQYPYSYAFTLWDGTTGQRLSAFAANSEFVTFSLDGNFLVAEIDERVAIIGRGNGFQPRFIAEDAKGFDVEGAVPAGFLLQHRESHWDGTKFNSRSSVFVLDFATAARKAEFPGGSAIISDDKQWMAVVDQTESDYDPAVPEVNVIDGKSLRPVCRALRPSGFAHARMSPHGRFLLMGNKLYTAPSNAAKTRALETAIVTVGALTPQRREEARAIFSNAFGLFQAGAFQKAADEFNRGLTIDPGNGPGNFYLAETYVRLKKPLLARQHYERTIKFAPGTKEAELAKKELAGM